MLPSGWEEQARRLGALRRARGVPNARVLLRLLLLHLAEGCSLAEAAARARQGGWCRVTPAAVFGRLQSAEGWLRWMAVEMWQRFRRLPGIADRRLLAVDATTVCEAGPTGSQWRLHYAINLSSLQCEFAALTDRSEGETFRRVPLHQGDVAMGDRAYGNPPGVAHVHEAGAEVLVRINLANLPLYTPQGRRMRMLARMRTLRIGQAQAWPACVHSGWGVVQGRLVGIKKSRRAAQAARRVLRRRARKTGEQLSPDTLRAASYVMLFTTLPAHRFPARRIVNLYRVRWQIELAFKRMKTIMNLGQLPKHAPASCRAWMHGKLLVSLLVERLIREAEAFSPWGYPLDLATESVEGDAVYAS
jgi:hypothetical protein